MTGVSTESLKKVEAALQTNASQHAASLAEELFAVVDVIDRDGTLRRALIDPSREIESRTGIVKAVFAGKISDSALNVVAEAVSQRWSEERDLADALETVATLSAAIAAESRGGVEALETVVNNLLIFINTVNTSAQAQEALVDGRASNEAKKKLAISLGGTNVAPESQLLLERAGARPRGLTAARVAQKFVEIIVKRQNRWIARVTAARPLSEAQIVKLQNALNKVYNKNLKLDITIDPAVVGGLRVQVGDEIVDGTVSTKLSELDRAVA
ncbi:MULTISPECIES: F0F1 ATP synthase subunit delta [unclassified Rothia (in: high G+C Gram-positive bacteria)]|uniref:F0F1 ATP synthase subunit delta n=1 Tax=unclassified Rothia (in: high G+C Gram-positive bacteria) TaxID=2689056 RepID=UPI0019562025|nr:MULTISPECIES: F0F1 ATP synthase subunit delta [unclassified Rothia (in: high G+C Gram-positive bacteria)]MBM7050993.1 F0F1 ATP synthase subunit delta [Rothia sp. ZJ1223]QRZ62278.1 F0F1 ATP synthase subunit delta [Rothia sp. ZJ932]